MHRAPSTEHRKAWRTVEVTRHVLVLARTVTTVTRLLDILTLISTDHRIQVTFTYDESRPARLHAGLREFLDSLEVPVIDWEQATRQRFDLVLAASENDRLHQITGPVLLFAHGIGYQKYYPDSVHIAGLSADRLTHSGKVVISAIALSHPDQCAELATACPEAAEHAVVVGDPCLDRLRASEHLETSYRTALGARDRTLVVLASTWGRHSLFGSDPDLAERLLADLPADEYRVAAVLHPGILSAHSPWQVRSWLSRARESGLLVIPPHEGWRAAVIAASCVFSDEGSLALYAAAQDKPLVLAGETSPTTVPGSPLAALAARADRLRPDRGLREQVDDAIRQHRRGVHEFEVSRAVAHQGDSARLTRQLLHDTMRLPEPEREAEFRPVPVPTEQLPAVAPAFVVGASSTAESVALSRFPAGAASPAHDRLDYRHLTANLDSATRRQLDSATILCTELADDEQWRFTDLAREAWHRWPHAQLVAAGTDRRTCLVRARGGYTATVHIEQSRIAVDPHLLASLIHVRLHRTDCPHGQDRIRVGPHPIDVTITPGAAD